MPMTRRSTGIHDLLSSLDFFGLIVQTLVIFTWVSVVNAEIRSRRHIQESS